MIIRGPRPESHFTQIRNDVLRDARLSLRARGLLAYVLSMPDGYRASATDVADVVPEGREAVRTAQAELVAAGYVTLSKRQAEGGRWETDVTYFDEPQTSPETGFRASVNRASVDRASVSRAVSTEHGSEHSLSTRERAPEPATAPAAAPPLSKVEESWKAGWAAAHDVPAPVATVARALHVAGQALAAGTPEVVVVAAASRAGAAGLPWVDRYVNDVTRLDPAARPTPVPPPFRADTPPDALPPEEASAAAAAIRANLASSRRRPMVRATVPDGAPRP